MDTKTTESQLEKETERPTFLELLDDYDYPYPRRGEIVTGEVLLKQKDVVYIDVGSKRDAIIPYDEVQELDDDWLDSVAIGDEIPVYVTNTPTGNDDLIVSVEKVLAERDWDRAQQCLQEEEIVDLTIIGYNKGGLLVEFGRLRGFVPNSHVPELRHLRDHRQLISAKANIVEEKIPLKIIEIDRTRKRLVLSGTAVQEELVEKQLQELEEGQKVTGTAVNIKKYGVFIDLGYVTGLLHISQMAWHSIGHPSDLIEVGDEVETIIDHIDIEQKRISLNRRALLPSPLDKFNEEHDQGDLVEGRVTNIRDFGAFVEIEEGVEGLVHVSEMDLMYGAHPSDALQSGDTILVRILRIEPEEGRIGLSISKVSAEEQIEWMQRHHEHMS